MPKKEKKPIDLGSFVKVWTRAASLEAVAKHFGVPKQAVSIKATILRKKGVKMRKFDRGVAASPKPKWTVDELNKIISEATKRKPGRPRKTESKASASENVLMTAH